jgi:adenine-specific DNA methylase
VGTAAAGRLSCSNPSGALAGSCGPELPREISCRGCRANESPSESSRRNSAAELRAALLDFIADFSDWDLANEPHYLETSRSLVQTAHEALGGTPGTRPSILDPFAGGGAIPLEALRMGAQCIASDINPVAVLLNRVTVDHLPHYGDELLDAYREASNWIAVQLGERVEPLWHDELPRDLSKAPHRGGLAD